MGARRIIPCLDISGPGVVKGVRFRDLRSQGDPTELAVRYERQGADEIVLLDIVAGRRGRSLRTALVRAVARATTIPLTVGGGIGTADQAGELLSAGADRVSFNTPALRRPALLEEAADRFGRQAVVLAVDASHRGAGRYEVVADGGRLPTGRSAAAWAEEGTHRGAGEVLLTSIDRDGTRTGFDLRLLRAVRGRVRVPVIASGGARNAGSFLAAFRAGADAALAAGILHEGHTTVDAIKAFLGRSGIEVRP